MNLSFLSSCARKSVLPDSSKRENERKWRPSKECEICWSAPPKFGSVLPSFLTLQPHQSNPTMDDMTPSSAAPSGTTSAKRTRSPSPAASTVKKVKTDSPAPTDPPKSATTPQPASKSLLPPSTFLFGRQRPEDGSAETLRPPMETDVGILEYVRREGDAFHGIIKQRCGFLLFLHQLPSLTFRLTFSFFVSLPFVGRQVHRLPRQRGQPHGRDAPPQGHHPARRTPSTRTPCPSRPGGSQARLRSPSSRR